MTLRGSEPDPQPSLDPADWEAFRDLAHRLLDDALDHLRAVPERPVWQPVPEAVRHALPIDGLDPHLITVPTVPIRTPAGTPRPLAEIDREVAALVEQAIAAGRPCLLHVLAGSKTGLSAPSFEAVQRLHERFGARLDVVVDACQMRLAPSAFAPVSRRAGWSC